MNCHLIAILTFLAPIMVLAADEPKAPATVKELWADFDPRKDALDAKIVREWEKDGIVYRYVTFHIGNFMDKPARMAGFFGFAKGAKKLPSLLHLHGGGQLCDLALELKNGPPVRQSVALVQPENCSGL